MVSVGILHGDFSDEAIILYRRLGYRDPVAGLRFSEADGFKIYSVYTIMGEGVLACEGHVVSVQLNQLAVICSSCLSSRALKAQ